MTSTSYATTIILPVITCVLSFLHGFATIYMTRLYIMARGAAFIRLRYPGGVLFQAGSIVFIEFIVLPYIILRASSLTNVFGSTNHHIGEPEPFETVEIALIYITILIGFWRLWLLIYSYMYNVESVHCRLTGEDGWFIKHIDSFGNPLKACSAVAIGSVFVIGISAIYVVIDVLPIFILAAPTLFFAVVFGFLWYTQRKISHFDDVTQVRAEVQRCGIVLVLFVLSELIITVIRIEKVVTRNVGQLIQANILVVFCSASIFVQTISVLRGWKQYHSRPEALRASKGQYIKLDDFIHRIEGYRLFLNYLAEDYATENIFFVSEAVHFYRSFCSELEDEEMQKKAKHLFDLPHDMPESDVMRIEEWKRRFEQIFVWYIGYDGHRSINIPWIMRESVGDFYNSHFAVGRKQRHTTSTEHTVVSSILRRWHHSTSKLPASLTRYSRTALRPTKSHNDLHVKNNHNDLNQPLLYELTPSLTVDMGSIDESSSTDLTVHPSSRTSQSLTVGHHHEQTSSSGTYLSATNAGVRKTVEIVGDDKLLKETMMKLIECAVEIQGLMRGSFLQFVGTREYETFAKEMGRKTA